MHEEATFERILDRQLDALRAITYSESAQPEYDMLSDAVYWEDEVPSVRQSELVNFMRYMFHLRMEAARARDVRIAAVWKRFKDLVPSWPGFRPERCRGTDLLALYEKLYVKPQLPPD